MHVDVSKGIPKIMLEDQKTGQLPDQAIIISGGIGSGKTSLSSTLAFFYYNAGYKIIFLWDAKDKFENAFSMFEPIDKWHIKGLKKYGVPITAIPTKILHPYTHNIPEHKIPEIQFYTIPIKNIGRQELSFISETNADTSTIKVMIDTINDLKNTDGLQHLIYYAENKAESQENYKGKQLRSLDPKAFFTKGAQGSTQKTISTAIGLFKPFQIDYMITPGDCKYNLNMKEIINDQKHYTVCTAKYIQDPKMKHFVVDNFLHELDRTLSKNEARYPILLIIPEVRKLTPVKTEGYTIFLSSDVKELLSTCRNKGEGVSEIMDTQVYFDVNKDVRKSSTETIFGMTGSLDEIEDIAKALSLGKQDKQIMAELTTGEFVCKSLNSYTEKWKPFRTPHMHADKGLTFEKVYEEKFPEKMRKYDEIKEYMKNIQDRVDAQVLNMAKAYNDEVISAGKNKEKDKQQKTEEKIRLHTEQVIKKSNKQTETELAIARIWTKKYDEGTSLQKIADEYKTYKEKIRRGIEKIKKIDSTVDKKSEQ